MENKPRITSTELARRLGISQSTVSRALSGHPRVNEHTRKRILDEAKAMGYQPNVTARFLRNGRVGALGLLIDANREMGAKNWYINRVLRETAMACSNAEVNMSMHQLELTGRKPNIKFHRNRVDGVIVSAGSNLEEICEALDEALLPFVLLRRRLASVDAPYITTDDSAGMVRALRYIYGLGHRHIAYVGPPRHVGRSRIEGYFQAHKDLGLPAHDAWVIEREHPLEVVGNLFYDKPYPTAVMCYDDRHAFDLIRWCQTHGIGVPGDLSVCGFGDEDFAELLDPSLTTVHFPIKEMVEEAVGELIRAIDHGERPQLQKTVSVHLVERQTTAPPRKLG